VTGVSPDLYTDPGKRLPPRRTFLLRFDAPVSPDLANVSGDTFQLVDLDDRPGGFPNGLPSASTSRCSRTSSTTA